MDRHVACQITRLRRDTPFCGRIVFPQEIMCLHRLALLEQSALPIGNGDKDAADQHIVCGYELDLPGQMGHQVDDGRVEPV